MEIWSGARARRLVEGDPVGVGRQIAVESHRRIVERLHPRLRLETVALANVVVAELVSFLIAKARDVLRIHERAVVRDVVVERVVWIAARLEASGEAHRQRFSSRERRAQIDTAARRSRGRRE